VADIREYSNETSGSLKGLSMFCPSQRLLASYKGLCSMDVFIIIGAKISMLIFRIVAQGELAGRYECSAETCRLHLQG
jgi:hypothetical protein